jgi:hypothetical protein
MLALTYLFRRICSFLWGHRCGLLRNGFCGGDVGALCRLGRFGAGRGSLGFLPQLGPNASLDLVF